MTSRLRIVRQAGLLLLLAYTILYLLVIYLVMISTLMPRGLFLGAAPRGGIRAESAGPPADVAVQ